MCVNEEERERGEIVIEDMCVGTRIVRLTKFHRRNDSLERNLSIAAADAAADGNASNQKTTDLRGVPNFASSTLGTGGNCTSMFLFPADMAREMAELACLDI